MGVKLLLLFTLAVATAKFMKRNNLKKRTPTAYIHNVSSVPTYIHIVSIVIWNDVFEVHTVYAESLPEQ